MFRNDLSLNYTEQSYKNYNKYPKEYTFFSSERKYTLLSISHSYISLLSFQSHILSTKTGLKSLYINSRKALKTKAKNTNKK